MTEKSASIVVYSEHEYCLEFRGPLSTISACHPPTLSPPLDDINKQWNINTLLCPSLRIILQWPSQDSNRPCNNSFPHWGDDMLSRQQITSPTLWVMLLTFLSSEHIKSEETRIRKCERWGWENRAQESQGSRWAPVIPRSDIPCIMQPRHNLSLTLGSGQINFVTESAQQALTDLLNPNYCLELRQGFDLDINLFKTDASLLASTIYMEA